MRESRRVMFAYCPVFNGPDWFSGIDTAFRPVGLPVVQAHSGPDAVAWVERGGLAGAVVVGDRARIDGLALLRIIRSIDAELPCCLVTAAPTRPLLEAALALRATCVMDQPASAVELALTVQRLLAN